MKFKLMNMILAGIISLGVVITASSLIHSPKQASTMTLKNIETNKTTVFVASQNHPNCAWFNEAVQPTDVKIACAWFVEAVDQPTIEKIVMNRDGSFDVAMR